MDRRYYGLKMLILVVGLAAAVVSSLFGAQLSPEARVNYNAAESVQAAVAQTTVKVSHAIGNLVHRRDCFAGE